MPAPAPAFVTVSTGLSLKVAVTALAAPIVTRHVDVPAHAPDQPAKIELAVAVAVSVTTVPVENAWVQSAGHTMPAGELRTVPPPFPAFVTVNTRPGLKVAVTDFDELIVTWHVDVPAHAPDHRMNADPAAGVAVSVTTCPRLNVAMHVAPHVMPAGLLVTLPAPAPLRVTDNVRCGGPASTSAALRTPYP